VFRINKLADYATVIMTFMARHPDETHSAAAVALRLDIAQPTVAKILKLLARGNLLVAQRGASGGYVLGRAPGEISVADIVVAIEGLPLGLTECSTNPGVCAQESSCAIRGNWQNLSAAVRRGLEGVTLADMLLPAHTFEGQVVLFSAQEKPTRRRGAALGRR